MSATSDIATESDVALDLLAIVDDAPDGRLVGSEETVVEEVRQDISDPATFVVTLDNGQQFSVRVREIS